MKYHIEKGKKVEWEDLSDSHLIDIIKDMLVKSNEGYQYVDTQGFYRTSHNIDVKRHLNHSSYVKQLELRGIRYIKMRIKEHKSQLKVDDILDINYINYNELVSYGYLGDKFGSNGYGFMSGRDEIIYDSKLIFKKKKISLYCDMFIDLAIYDNYNIDSSRVNLIHDQIETFIKTEDRNKKLEKLLEE